MVCSSHLRVALRPWIAITFIFIFVFVSLRSNFPSFYFANSSKSHSLYEKTSSKEFSEEGDIQHKIFHQVTESKVSKLTSYITRLQSSGESVRGKDLCPLVSPKLVGWTNVSLTKTTSAILEGNDDAEESLKQAGVKAGGRYEPEECQSRHKVAIVIPYRNRTKHLPVFLRHLHPFLQRQQLSYVIIVVEQSNGSPFNRGMLLNIGFKEALLQEQYQCFIFHDVDFLPENDGNPYSCPEDGKPRQMAFSIDYWDNYSLVPMNFFGGVTAISTRDFYRINGYSNSFWGWGGEDDQLYQRVLFNNLTVTRPFIDQPSLVHRARYKTLSHEKAEPNPDRKRVLQEGSVHFKTDGLANLQYERLDLQFNPLYTNIRVDIKQN